MGEKRPAEKPAQSSLHYAVNHLMDSGASSETFKFGSGRSKNWQAGKTLDGSFPSQTQVHRSFPPRPSPTLFRKYEH
jgi:hypothetical protein